MFETIEKLLILQDRDRQINRVKTELDHIEPERHVLKTKSAGAQNALDKGKLKVRKHRSRNTPINSSRPARTKNIARSPTKSRCARKTSSKSRTRKSN